MIILRDLIGSELRKIREDQGRTLRDVSERAMVSYSYLSEIERGHKEASSELLAAICGSLKIQMSDVLEGVVEEMRHADLTSIMK